MSWRVAQSLETALAEVNASAPNRSKVSDGSIGDAAHASRSSDHNPWIVKDGVGIVRARDFTHDPAGGFDAGRFAAAVAGLLGKHPALKTGAYVIWNRRIVSADRLGEGWRTYTGSNPHDHHCHVSVTTDPNRFDSTAPWLTTAPEDDMFSDEDRANLNTLTGRVATIQTALDALAAAEKRRGDNQWRRDQRLEKVAKRTGKTVDQLVDELEAQG